MVIPMTTEQKYQSHQSFAVIRGSACTLGAIYGKTGCVLMTKWSESQS